MRKVGFLYSEKYLEHITTGHPEKKERLVAIVSHLEKTGAIANLVNLKPREASVDEIALIHKRAYIAEVEQACLDKLPSLDLDTQISEKSYEVARLAAGGVLEAIDNVIDGRVDNAFCAVRPPGHHAEHDRAMGFCLFNNIAIGAKYIQTKHKLKKVLIIDWDVHHGNGTSNSFYSDPTVFYFSIHQYPHYPGTGHMSETGAGEGEGATLNVHFPANLGDCEYIKTLVDFCKEEAAAFDPDFVLISAGFDAHRDDFLSSMSVSSEGFGKLTRIILDFADRVCSGRVVSVLEGGYNLEALGESVDFHLKELMR